MNKTKPKIRISKLDILIVIVIILYFAVWFLVRAPKSIAEIAEVTVTTSEVIFEPEIIPTQIIVPKILTMEEKINNYVDEICLLYPLIEPALVKSVIYFESTFNPDCKTGSCLGLMQVSTRWHKERMQRLGVTNLYDPYGNILVGVDYLSELQTKNKNISLTLMMYNMSHNKARELSRKGIQSKYAKSVLKRAAEIK